MASWKLSAVLLLSVMAVLVLEAEARRNRVNAGRRRNRGQGEDDDENAVVDASYVADAGGNSQGGRNAVGAAGSDGEGGIGGGQRGRGRRPSRRGNGAGRGQAGRPGRRPAGRPGRRPGRGNRRRQMNPAKVAMLMAGLQSSVNRFSVELYRALTTVNNDNFVFSPYSVYSALAMTLMGASGNTKRQLTVGLSITSPVIPAIRLYNASLSRATDSDADVDAADDDDGEDDVDDVMAADAAASEESPIEMAVANKMYVRNGLEYNPRFASKVQAFFGVSVSEFEPVNPETAVNAWVSEATNGEITDFLESGDISQDTIIMLINAIYFKGTWKSQFDAAQTIAKPFNRNGLPPVDVDMMRKTGNYRVQHSDVLEASVLELPYEGDRFAFFIVLPDESTDVNAVESRLTPDVLNETLSVPADFERLALEVPSFSLDAEEMMKDALTSMGIEDLFTQGVAKLRKISRDRTLFVEEVQHRCIIEVDEEGTVAAAVTGVMIARYSAQLNPPREFKVDRPFMFVLRDKEAGLNLFMGRFSDPEGDSIMA